MGILSSKPVKPATVPTDTIIPLFSQDGIPSFRALVLDFTMCFDDVLDPEKLRGSLARLMEIGDWRKLGARLRLKDSRDLEYHVPASFDEARPAFRYSHVKYDINISEHPLASKFPRATTRPTVLDSHDFQPITRRAGGPTKLEDYLYSDDGQLSLHIVSFNDATLVTLTWPHTLFDAMGRRALFDAWISVLDGRESEVKPFHGFNSNPLETVGSKTTEPHALVNRQIKGFTFFMFALRMAYELIWHSKEETRVVCLPAKYINSMKLTALSELATYSSASDSKPFLSDGDIISAWWTRLACSMVPRNSKRLITIMNVFGMRGALEKDLLPADKAYIGNAAHSVHTFIPANALFNRPISYTAALVRRSIAEQGTRPQIEALAAMAKQSYIDANRPPIFGDGTTKLIVFSNWTKARFFELDFSAAVIKQGLPFEKRKHGLGNPRYLHAHAYTNNMPVRNAFQISGKDEEGNYWFSGTMRTETWKQVEEDFNKGY